MTELMTGVVPSEDVDLIIECLERSKHMGNPNGEVDYRKVSQYRVSSKDLEVWGIALELVHAYSKQSGIIYTHLNEANIMRYGHGEFYQEHMDVSFDDPSPQRKISLVVQLDDGDNYEGGKTVVTGDCTEYVLGRERGSYILFPAYAIHRVEPITSGVRRSLVGWATGPTWQ